MFTGIIEETGIIKNVEMKTSGCVLTIEAKKVLLGTKIGDSISVNGTCQTVISMNSNSFKTELSNETVSVTNFSNVKKDDIVNLERAMQMSSRLDGHIVNGHVDTTAKFVSTKNDGFSQNLTFEIDKNFARYLVYKASIAINGISLTISKVEGQLFSTAVIPLTQDSTNLKYLKKGDIVNIEIDILAKYVEKFLSLKDNNTTNIDNNFLKENGFI